MARVKHNETEYQDYLAKEAKAGRTPENDAELRIMSEAYNKGTLSFHYDVAPDGSKTANIARYSRPNEFTNSLKQTVEHTASNVASPAPEVAPKAEQKEQASVVAGKTKVKPAVDIEHTNTHKAETTINANVEKTTKTTKTTVNGPKNVDQDYHYDAKRGVFVPNAREPKPESKEQKAAEIVEAKPAYTKETKESASVLSGKGGVHQANAKDGVELAGNTVAKDNIVRGPSRFDEDYKYNKERNVVLPQFHQPKPEPKEQKAAEIVDAKPTWSRPEEGSVLSGHSGVKTAMADAPKVTKTGDTVCMTADEFTKLTGAKVAGGSVLSGKVGIASIVVDAAENTFKEVKETHLTGSKIADGSVLSGKVGIASVIADTAENTFKAVKETHNNNIESLKGSFDGVAEHLAILEHLKNGIGQCYADGKDKINGYHGTLVNSFPEGHDRVAFGRWVKSEVAKKQFSKTDLEKLKAIEESGGLFFVGDDDKGFKDAIMRVKSIEGVYYGCAKEYKNQDTIFAVDKGGADGLKITDGRKIDENLHLLRTSCENIDKLDHRFGGSCSVINDETIAQLKKHKEELDERDRENNRDKDKGRDKDKDRDKDGSNPSGDGGSRGDKDNDNNNGGGNSGGGNNDHGGGNDHGNDNGGGGNNGGGNDNSNDNSNDNDNDNNNDNSQDNSAGLN